MRRRVYEIQKKKTKTVRIILTQESLLRAKFFIQESACSYDSAGLLNLIQVLLKKSKSFKTSLRFER